MVRLECEALKKAYEATVFDDKINPNETDFPEVLAYEYLVAKGYWKVGEDGITNEEEIEPKYGYLTLLDITNRIAKDLRRGKSIEEILAEKVYCNDKEEDI